MCSIESGPCAAAAAGGDSRRKGVDELSVEGHVDEGVEAAVEREQPEQPAERRHCNETDR